jgi:hypothetical protein
MLGITIPPLLLAIRRLNLRPLPGHCGIQWHREPMHPSATGADPVGVSWLDVCNKVFLAAEKFFNASPGQVGVASEKMSSKIAQQISTTAFIIAPAAANT